MSEMERRFLTELLSPYLSELSPPFKVFSLKVFLLLLILNLGVSKSVD
jgi:hypothetical protein